MGSIYGNSHIWAPCALREKRFFYSYMGDIYGEVFPIYAFLYRKGRPYLPLFSFSYLGAVSFLNLQFA